MSRTTEALAQALARVEERLAQIDEKVDRLHGEMSEETERLRRILRAIAAEDADNRRRLAAARARPEYELAFTDPDPLVSVVIPTHDRAVLLRDRSVASALAQTHANLEIVVIGDDSPAEVQSAIASLGDSRVSFHRLATPYRAAEDTRSQWQVRSVMARTEGLRMARGRWLVAFDDDDEMREDHVSRLLSLARSRHAEVAYGLAQRNWPEATDLIGVFPPRFGQFTWQCAIYHAGLGFFERQLVAMDFDLPADWFMCEAMLRAGVRFAMLDEVVAEIYPSEATRAERERQLAQAFRRAPSPAPSPARPPPGVTPWDAPSRFRAPGRLARGALRRIMRPLEVRHREADEVLAAKLEEQSQRLDSLGSELRALNDG